MPDVPSPDEIAARSTTGADSERARGGVLWTRQDDAKPRAITREEIVRTAIAIADAEGLDAVSMRRIAAELTTQPKTLYLRVTRKDDLLDLMFDDAIGETVLEPAPEDWRAALRQIAEHTRTSCLRHPWVMTIAATRPALGPNAIRHREQSLAVVANLGFGDADTRALLTAIDAYVLGHVTGELAERELRRREQLTPAQWDLEVGAYVLRETETGAYPHLAEHGRDALLPRDHDRTFATGLDWLLAGAANSLTTEHPSAQ